MLEEDQPVLRELSYSCKDAKEKIRYLALHALSRGHVVPTVADVFCVDESAVYRWIEKWKTERSASNRPKSGRPPLLEDDDRQRIKELVEENDPKKHGVNASAWDTRELQKYFSCRGKKFSRDVLRVALHQMGAHYVKATIQYAEADVEKQRVFAEQFFNDLKNKPRSVVVLFEDEASVECRARKGYGWTFEKRLVVTSHQRRTRLNCFGAVNPLAGRVLQMSSAEAKAPAFIRFLKKVERKHPHKVVWLYADRGSVHRSKLVKAFLEKHPNIKLRFLPPYSPDANPQEEWWRFLRAKFLVNKSFETTHELATALSGFVRLTPRQTIRSVCSLAPISKLLTV